ncbi:MAG: hypothetical protein ACK424_04835, partial [Candidatus Thermochlorobacter sp.]
LVERPRLPVDIRISPRFTTLSIPRTAIPADRSTYNNLVFNRPSDFGNIFAFNEDVAAAVGIDAGVSLNLARWVGITQLFAVVDGGLLFPLAAPQNATAPLFWNVHLGIQKKFWFSWINLSIGAFAGADFLTISGTSDNDGRLENFNVGMPSGRLDATLEFMLNPDLLFSIRAGYKLASPPIFGSIKFRGDDEIELTLEDRLRPFRDINFSGLIVSANISFTLPSSSAVDISFPSDIDY